MDAIARYLRSTTAIAPLIFFRVLFGLMMAVSVIRFIVNGWVYDLYIKPKVFFPFYGFEWVKPLSANAMYIVFAVMLISAVGIMLGAFYRWTSVLFFLSFTYVELIDKTNYLNHYYFVSLISFLLIFLPAHRAFSFDAWKRNVTVLSHVPCWTIDAIKFQLAIVYIYAGIAKLNYAWLIEAMPLKLWLPANSHVPYVGALLAQEWVAYAFSWFGAIYDLFIVFFLIMAGTRIFAYAAVIVFHVATWLLFPIGMFPFIMILSTLIFFSNAFHERIIQVLRRLLRLQELSFQSNISSAYSSMSRKLIISMFALFFVIQVAMPWRYLLYPGDLFWTEQGYRFSWRVMLMEKAGYVIFHVNDPATGKSGDIMPEDYLTPIQVKMMSTQPDMILQFAHYLKEELKTKGLQQPEVRAEAYATLNGSGTRPFIDASVDLTTVRDSFKHKDWILSFQP